MKYTFRIDVGLIGTKGWAEIDPNRTTLYTIMGDSYGLANETSSHLERLAQIVATWDYDNPIKPRQKRKYKVEMNIEFNEE